MKLRTTISEGDIKEACSLLMAKRGFRLVGDIAVSHTPAGFDRPYDPSSTSITFEVEDIAPPADVSMK